MTHFSLTVVTNELTVRVAFIFSLPWSIRRPIKWAPICPQHCRTVVLCAVGIFSAWKRRQLECHRVSFASCVHSPGHIHLIADTCVTVKPSGDDPSLDEARNGYWRQSSVLRLTILVMVPQREGNLLSQWPFAYASLAGQSFPPKASRRNGCLQARRGKHL